jgi:DNA-binding response OmpR family regulator
MTRILIVEDDPAIQGLLDDILRDEGFETVVAADGQSGIERARSERPHLILMDIMLPVKDGVAAIRELKSDPATSPIPIIAMSASATFDQQAGTLPADDVLRKPFNLEVLLARVTSHLQTAS